MTDKERDVLLIEMAINVYKIASPEVAIRNTLGVVYKTLEPARLTELYCLLRKESRDEPT